jgi:hypothetical protein
MLAALRQAGWQAAIAEPALPSRRSQNSEAPICARRKKAA